MNCDRAEKAEKASNPGNLPTSLLLISRMKKILRKKNAFFGVFLTVLVQFWFLTLIYSYDMDILQKNGSKRPFLPEIDAQTFWYTLYRVTTACCVSWQIPKTQQGNLLPPLIRGDPSWAVGDGGKSLWGQEACPPHPPLRRDHPL